MQSRDVRSRVFSRPSAMNYFIKRTSKLADSTNLDNGGAQKERVERSAMWPRHRQIHVRRRSAAAEHAMAAAAVVWRRTALALLMSHWTGLVQSSTSRIQASTTLNKHTTVRTSNDNMKSSTIAWNDSPLHQYTIACVKRVKQPKFVKHSFLKFV